MFCLQVALQASEDYAPLKPRVGKAAKVCYPESSCPT